MTEQTNNNSFGVRHVDIPIQLQLYIGLYMYIEKWNKLATGIISQEEIELNPLKKKEFEVFAFLASLNLVNISG